MREVHDVQHAEDHREAEREQRVEGAIDDAQDHLRHHQLQFEFARQREAIVDAVAGQLRERQ